MLGPFIEVGGYIRSLIPTPGSISKFRFNFIIIHYIYMIALTLLGGCIIYGAKNMAFVDALFFASGSATQSGLNTVNMNDTLLYQQMACMLIACVGNPIFIHTTVVFARLYWFEKRFQNVVLEAQRLRRTTRERTRTKSQAKEDHDMDMLERGADKNNIEVVHPESNRNRDAVDEKVDGTENSGEDQSSESDKLADDKDEEAKIPFHRDITFADEMPRPTRRGSEPARMPEQRSAEANIAFVESQRNTHDDDEVLYIPGPRDFEKGKKPQRKNRPPSLAPPESNGDFPDLEEEDEKAEDVDHEHREQSRPTPGRHRPITNPVVAVAKAQRNLSGLLREKIPNKLQPVQEIISPHRAPDNSAFTPKTHRGIYSPTALRERGRVGTFASFLSRTRSDEVDPMPYLSYQPTIGRNSAFVNLTEQQREELGGIEYRALKCLAIVLVCYFFGFMILGFICYVPWILNAGNRKGDLRGYGISPTWWGFFTATSMFTDLGLTLTPNSMSDFNNAVFPLILGSFLIIIGNTGFPIMLRFVIWTLSKLVPQGSPLWEELRFLLDHPRRCFTLLFPGKATWWLFWVLVLFNVIDLVFFIILDLNDPVVTSLPVGIRVLDGWFQACSTRTAGFSVINLAALHPAIQVSYLIMMYISVFPIAISVRRTNVYEERSLGVYSKPSDNDDDDDNEESGNRSYVGSHLRRQLSFDLWYIFLGMFIIAIVEGNRLQNTNEWAFSLFSVLFEIVSAYGTVGLSLGYPNYDPSFSGQFSTISKLVIIAMEIRGRHRGLPYELDKAVMLPSERLQQKEHELTLPRSMSRSMSQGVGDMGPGGASAGTGFDMNRTRDATYRSGATTANAIDAEAETAAPMTHDNRTRTGMSEGMRSTVSARTGHGRSRTRSTGGLSRLISSALSAGPTKPKSRDE